MELETNRKLFRPCTHQIPYQAHSFLGYYAVKSGRKLIKFRKYYPEDEGLKFL
jgi:hypothetical protein